MVFFWFVGSDKALQYVSNKLEIFFTEQIRSISVINRFELYSRGTLPTPNLI